MIKVVSGALTPAATSHEGAGERRKKTLQRPKKEKSGFISNSYYKEEIQKEAPKTGLKHQERQLKKLFSAWLESVLTESSSSSQKTQEIEPLSPDWADF